MTTSRPLMLFLPGAFAHLPETLRAEFGRSAPGVELAFHAFIPSGLLAREIRAGAPADLYVSANTRYMEELSAEGLVQDARVLAGNRLCIIVRPAAAERVRGLADLTRAEQTLVVPQPETDPCGQYIAQMFREQGIADVMEAKRAAGTLLHSRGSGDLPGFLADGRVEAGIFYLSEVGALGDSVVMVPLPPDADFSDRITFTVGLVQRPDPHPAAPSLHAWLLGSEGQAMLTAAGFLPTA